MSAREEARKPQDQPDPAVIFAALYRAGTGAVLAGRTFTGGKPGPGGCLTACQETSYEPMPAGLAVPSGNGGRYLGCTACRARLTGPPGGKCPGYRKRGRER
jgi:hypothetical protein